MALETLFFNKARCFAVFQEEDVSVGKRDKIANKEGGKGHSTKWWRRRKNFA